MTSQDKDIRRLSLLGICHYVLSGFAALIVCIIVAHFLIATADDKHTVIIKIALGMFFSNIWIAVAISLLASGQKLRQRKDRVFSMVVAGIGCIVSLYGMNSITIFSTFTIYRVVRMLVSVAIGALSVFTVITLNTKSVKELYKNLRESADEQK